MAEITLVQGATFGEAVRNAREVQFRGGGFAPKTHRLLPWIFFTCALSFWQVAIDFGWLNPIFLPSPAAIVRSLWAMVVTGTLWQHLSISLFRIGLGWIVGTAFGLCVGVAMGLHSATRAVFRPLVSALYPVPKIAILPLFILWLGIGELPKWVLIASGVFFPTLINTLAGVDSVPQNLIRMGQSFNMPMLGIIRKVILPSAMPSILAGFRISIATALLLVVSAEMIGAQFGIGAFLLTAGNLMQTDDLMAGVVILSVLGLTIGGTLSTLEKTMLSWR